MHYYNLFVHFYFVKTVHSYFIIFKRISYGYRFFTNFKAKILLVFSLFTPTEAIKKPKYSKEEHQAILTKKKTIKLKRKNRKKAILLNIA